MTIEIAPDSAVAYLTAVLALGTVALALFTYRLAKAATATQRAEWRPVLIAASAVVDESAAGELGIEVCNVGRGPALGVGGELHISGPSGGAIPGQPNVCLPGETLALRFRLNGEFPRGNLHRFEVTYYDIGEWWHVADLTAIVREQGGPLIIAEMFVSEMNRQLLFGSRRAKAKKETESAVATCLAVAAREDWRHR